MKVIQINEICGYGSIGNICLDISKHMSNKNI